MALFVSIVNSNLPNCDALVPWTGMLGYASPFLSSPFKAVQAVCRPDPSPLSTARSESAMRTVRRVLYESDPSKHDPIRVCSFRPEPAQN
jgi:hypothetical protein